MRWGRGLFRLWIVLSVLWAAPVSVLTWPKSDSEDVSLAIAIDRVLAEQIYALKIQATPEAAARVITLENKRTEQHSALKYAKIRQLLWALAPGLLPPLLIFGVGLALFWAIRGFAPLAPAPRVPR